MDSSLEITLKTPSSPKITHKTGSSVIADTKFGKYGELFGYGGSDLFTVAEFSI